MKKILVLSPLVIFIFFISCSTIWAEDPAGRAGGTTGESEEYQFFDLGEIFVTVEKVPASTDVTVTTEITAEGIRATNSRTVAEALSYVPGG